MNRSHIFEDVSIIDEHTIKLQKKDEKKAKKGAKRDQKQQQVLQTPRSSRPTERGLLSSERAGDKDAGEDDSEEEFHRDKNEIAMEELKEVDMNYLINEDSDADDMFQNSANKKKKNVGK